MKAAPELIAMAHTAGYSSTKIYQLGLMYVTRLLELGLVLPEVGKESQESLVDLVESLVDYTVSVNEEYIEKVNAVEEQDEKATAAFTKKLIEVACKNRKEYKCGDTRAIGKVKRLVKKDKTGRASYEDLDFFLTHWDDGRVRIPDIDRAREEAEIVEFITQMMKPAVQQPEIRLDVIAP